jgi:hypothetical protein
MKNTEEMKHFQTAAPATLSTCPWQFDHIPSHFLYRQAEEYNVRGKREPFTHVSANDTDLIFTNTKCHGELDGITLYGTFVEERKFVWSFRDAINSDIPSARLKSLLDASKLLDGYSDRTCRGWDDRFQSRPFAPPTNPKAIQDIRTFLDNTLMKLRSVTLADIG